MKGYSTHGEWATLDRIRELESERDNYFPDLPYPPETPAIWICLSPENCFYYEPEMKLEDLTEIEIDSHYILCAYDSNGGFLLLEPDPHKFPPETSG